ncbi:inositol monophosphatase family protein [Planctomicrobium sp. SH664]|uniref:inositol monophosphatase family protein n=1 Tax=Planctomicrobium sp. SH664 TaxID=3448125 RepID=UPI003F5B23A2
MSAALINQRLQFGLDASAVAERLVLDYYLQSGLQVDWKSDLSPVTAADRGAEELLRQQILKNFPEDAVLGEEFGETPGSSGFRWILDPVDGTKSFIHGTPLFGMLVGLQFRGEPVAGICRLPAVREVIYAARGEGAWWIRGDQPAVRAQVTGQTRLKESLFCYTAVEGFTEIGRLDALEKLSAGTRLSRGWGDCYGHMLVATGRADLMVDPLLAEWDAAALIPIIQEAGGDFVNWNGESSATGGNGISLTPALRNEVLKLLQA